MIASAKSRVRYRIPKETPEQIVAKTVFLGFLGTLSAILGCEKEVQLNVEGKRPGVRSVWKRFDD